MALETVGKTAGGTQKRHAWCKNVKTNHLMGTRSETKEIASSREWVGGFGFGDISHYIKDTILTITHLLSIFSRQVVRVGGLWEKRVI
jgi:hypothetical protein